MLAELAARPYAVGACSVTAHSLFVFAIAFGLGLRVLAKLFGVSFGLLCCLISVFANLCNTWVFTRWFNIDDKARLIRRANNPPVRKDRTGESSRNKHGSDQEATHCGVI